MKRTIGLVCEGPRDIDLITSIIDHLFPAYDIEYRYLQPESSLKSINYNGWKGVLRWCRKDYSSVCATANFLDSDIDFIIVQIDGDVSRDKNNKQSHCNCINVGCDEAYKNMLEGIVLVEECSKHYSECPLPFPCDKHSVKKYSHMFLI